MKIIKNNWLKVAIFFVLTTSCLTTLAQTKEWPENWMVIPPKMGDRVIHLDVDPNSDTPIVRVKTEKDVGQVFIDVDMPVTPQTTLKWNWNVEDLPSDVAENTDKTHDYFAVAVRFNNDQILSYIWSATLDVGDVFSCPLPNWKDREIHIVLHSGSKEFGKWISEERNLLEDYSKYKEEKLPLRIAQVWIIAASIAQGGGGAMKVKNITLGNDASDGDEQERTQVLAARGYSRLDRKIAAVNSTLGGNWSGTNFLENLKTGETTEIDIDINYSLISLDKLDYANWSNRGLTLGKYQGNGQYQLQQ